MPLCHASFEEGEMPFYNGKGCYYVAFLYKLTQSSKNIQINMLYIQYIGQSYFNGRVSLQISLYIMKKIINVDPHIWSASLSLEQRIRLLSPSARLTAPPDRKALTRS